MFLASIAHIYAFPVTPYKRDQTRSWWWNIANAANVSDFNSEVQNHANQFYDKLRTVLSRKSRSSMLEGEEDDRLIGGDGEEREEPGEDSSQLLINVNEELCKNLSVFLVSAKKSKKNPGEYLRNFKQRFSLNFLNEIVYNSTSFFQI
jgi:hypothetical protein